mmetsp:Transcript_22812/g.58058  ORF Transcript_22812/g.58058 Transcript_22812/m.58058 type:complete len:200 (+) Transcript_22812:655-1254(+)
MSTRVPRRGRCSTWWLPPCLPARTLWALCPSTSTGWRTTTRRRNPCARWPPRPGTASSAQPRPARAARCPPLRRLRRFWLTGGSTPSCSSWMRPLRSWRTTWPPPCWRQWSSWQPSSSCRTTPPSPCLSAAACWPSLAPATWAALVAQRSPLLMSTCCWMTTSTLRTCCASSATPSRPRRASSRGCCSRSACSVRRTRP